MPTSFQPDTDAAWAARTAQELETSHSTVLVTSEELAAALRTALHARDLPGMADIDASLYLLSVEVKKRFTVALSGECADEVFGGYPWFYSTDDLRRFPWSPNTSLRTRLVAPWLRERFSPERYVQERLAEALAEVPHLPGESGEEQRIRSLFYLNLTRWMPTLLDRKDRMSMAAGLEVRVPFCDHRLVEYAFNIPWPMKNAGGQRKGVLREALRGVLPESVRTRPKNPFPKTFEPTYGELVRSSFLRVLADHTAPLHELIDIDYLTQLVTSPSEFDLPWFGQLMRKDQLFGYLLQLNSWLLDYNVNISL